MASNELKERENNIGEIKNRLQGISDNDLVNVSFGFIEKEVLWLSKKVDCDDYVVDLLDCIFDVLIERKCINYDAVFLKINSLLQKIKNIRFDKSKENTELRLILKRTEKKLKDISLFLKTRYESMATSNDYLLLNELVFKIKDVGLFFDVVKQIPSLLLTKNDCGKYFYENLIKDYIVLVQSNDQKNMLDVLYYEIIIDEFLRKYKRNFVKVNNSLQNSINKAIEEVKRMKETKKSRDRRTFFLEDLKNKLKNNDFNFNEKLINLNKKYEKYNNFIGETKLDLNVKRLDFTKLYTITIDPENSLALDQAISYEKLDNGNSMLYVHLSDPASYIKKGSQIDNEAYRRSFTLYMSKSDTITMLPEELCYDKCSLLSNGSRVAVTHAIEFDNNYNVVNFNSYNSMVSVDINLSYDFADKILEGNEQSKLAILLRDLDECSNVIEKQNKNNRSKSNMNKIMKHIDSNIKSEEDYCTVGVNSQKIMCTIMSKTCELIASKANEKGIPFVYRVHNKIDYEKVIKEVDGLKKLLLGRNIPESEIQKMLKKTVFSKYNSAYYSKDNIGHNALGLSCYAKATCPMGNYSSFINERITKELIIDSNYSDDVIYSYEDFVEEAAKQLNNKKEINDNYVNEYMKIKNKH